LAPSCTGAAVFEAAAAVNFFGANDGIQASR